MGANKSNFGDKGYKELTSADGATAGDYYAIKAVNGADAGVDVTNRQGDNSTGLTIASGDIIYVTATSITVNSGTVHAYNA